MALGKSNVIVYIYNSDGTYRDVTNLISSMKYSCSLDKVSQQLDMTVSYGVYSVALPSFFFRTGQKIEVYIDGVCYYRGKIETVTLSVGKESLSLTCFDYIRNLTKSKVTYNFSDMSAFDAIKKIFNDLEIPYSDAGILGGVSGEGSKINIKHLIKNKSAYDACMMIATEVYRNFGTYYYMFMDVAGNVNIMACDRYWSKQTIKPCSDPSLPNPDGNIISFTYKEDVSDLITKVAIFDSKGNAVDIETGESTDATISDDSNDTGGE
jgi:hypothetical protein